MVDKAHIPLSGNSREQLRARIGILALACGVKDLPQEVEVDAFAEMARTTGLAESWKSAVGFPLPADRTEWFALLARGKIPAALFVEEKIRPREVLAYIAELENNASASPLRQLNPSAARRRLAELRESILRLHTLDATEADKYDHLHKLQEQVIRLACAACLLPPEVTPPPEGATGYELRLCWQCLAEFLAGPLVPHPKDFATAAIPLLGMDPVQYLSAPGDIVRWIDHGAALVRLLQDRVAVGAVGNELHLHAATVSEQIASVVRAGQLIKSLWTLRADVGRFNDAIHRRGGAPTHARHGTPEAEVFYRQWHAERDAERAEMMREYCEHLAELEALAEPIRTMAQRAELGFMDLPGFGAAVTDLTGFDGYQWWGNMIGGEAPAELDVLHRRLVVLVEREARESQSARIAAQAVAAAGIDSAAGAPARHSGDFTSVNWFGEVHKFALGVQSSAVKALWDEWEKSGLGLHQDTIRNAIDPERDAFRMDKAFRGHPALGTMIINVGDGRYRLNAPGKGGPSVPAGPKKSPRIPAKARRTPR